MKIMCILIFEKKKSSLGEALTGRQKTSFHIISTALTFHVRRKVPLRCKFPVY